MNMLFIYLNATKNSDAKPKPDAGDNFLDTYVPFITYRSGCLKLYRKLDYECYSFSLPKQPYPPL